MRWLQLAFVMVLAAGGAALKAATGDAGPNESAHPAARTESRAVAAIGSGTRRVGTRGAHGTPRVRVLEQAADPVEWPPPASREPCDPPPPPCTSIHGRVVDVAGSPIANVRVAAFLGTNHTDGRSGDDGEFSIDVDKPTGVVRVVAWGAGCAVSVGPWTELRNGESLNAGTIRLAREARIEGRIVASDGANACGSVVIDGTGVFDAETWDIVERCLDLPYVSVPYHCSGIEGFSVQGLPAGRYMLRVADGDQWAPVTAPASNIELASYSIQYFQKLSGTARCKIAMSSHDKYSKLPINKDCPRASLQRDIPIKKFDCSRAGHLLVLHYQLRNAQH